MNPSAGSIFKWLAAAVDCQEAREPVTEAAVAELFKDLRSLDREMVSEKIAPASAIGLTKINSGMVTSPPAVSGALRWHG